MAGKFLFLTRRFILIINIVFAVVFLLACLSPYLRPDKWWVISILGLGFTILFIIQVLFVLFWLVFYARYALISFICLLIGWQSIAVLFAVNSPEDFRKEKSKDVLRVVHWNVARFVEWRRNNNEGSRKRLRMMKQLKAQNADVICFVEFFHSTHPEYYDNLNYVMKELGYPYYTFSWEEDGDRHWVGQAIFSRYPILDSGKVFYPRPTMPLALVHADILFNRDTVRLYTTHLQSIRLQKVDYENIEKIKKTDEGMLEGSKSIFTKLKYGFIFRTTQSDITKDEISKSPHPYIVTGDFNDVPNSYTYFTISKGLQDAFLKDGFGIGRTFSFISPTLRIDYILATKDFEVQQFDRVVKDLSDHYMLVADFKLHD